MPLWVRDGVGGDEPSRLRVTPLIRHDGITAAFRTSIWNTKTINRFGAVRFGPAEDMSAIVHHVLR
jgi:hypothetical protein